MFTAGKQEGVDTILATLEVISEPFRSMAVTLVEMCAYAGTGNVLKVQQLLHICSEHYDTKDQVGYNISFLMCLITSLFIKYVDMF